MVVPACVVVDLIVADEVGVMKDQLDEAVGSCVLPLGVADKGCEESEVALDFELVGP